MIYCDTSVLIGALTTEARSPAIQAWLLGKPPGSLVFSGWVETEFASAIAMKSRIGDLDDTQRARVLATWTSMISDFHDVAIDRRHFELAAAIILEPGSKLRGGDALHMAIAQDRGFTLATLDKALRDTAMRAGLIVEAVIEEA